MIYGQIKFYPFETNLKNKKCLKVLFRKIVQGTILKIKRRKERGREREI